MLGCAVAEKMCAEDAQPTVRVAETFSPGSAAATTNSMDVLDDKRKLLVGDRLSYRVVEERKPPVSLVVVDSSEVEVPLLGRIKAEGKTCKELANDIRKPLEKEYFYKATVIISLDMVSMRSRGRVYISGFVHTQGPMEIPFDETFTLSKAILRAGGIAQFGNGHKVKLMRKKEGGNGEMETMVIDVESILEKGRGERDIELKPDDSILVPRKIINF
jgi:protein involved in polysaccharide export with SLBB domain